MLFLFYHLIAPYWPYIHISLEGDCHTCGPRAISPLTCGPPGHYMRALLASLLTHLAPARMRRPHLLTLLLAAASSGKSGSNSTSKVSLVILFFQMPQGLRCLSTVSIVKQIPCYYQCISTTSMITLFCKHFNCCNDTKQSDWL